MVNISSPMLRKMEKIDSVEQRTRSPTAIPFSTGTTWESRSVGDANSKSESEASYAKAMKQLRELKQLHDSLSVEAYSEEKHLQELQRTTKNRKNR